ncbi:MAG: hypothetical protein ACO28T_05365 [Schleiferiaceae bacterium]|jgi:hypothetical protein
MIRRTLLTAAALTASWSLAAQQQSVSPYSLFGAGWAQAQANAYQQFLGGASAADRNPWYLNPDQPASLSAIKYTTLDFGGQLSGVNQSDGTNRTLNRTGNFNSFGIAVPLTKGMGISGSLRPYTAVGYDFQQSGTDSSFGDWIQRYVGRGGLNATALTWSWAPIKYVSFGATARYLFGSADRSTKVYFTDGRFDFAGKVERVLVSDWRWNAGAQLILPIGLNELVAGVQYEPKADLSATQNYTWYSFKTNSDGAELPLDTVTSVYAAQGSIALGGRQAVGIRWATNRKNTLLPAWTLSGHFERTQVGDHRDFNAGSPGNYQGYAQAWIVQTSFVPTLISTKKKLSSYLSQVQYVASFRQDRFGLFLGGAEVRGWSGNLGMAMPVGGRSFIPGDVKVATVHLGLNFGRTGSVNQGLVREQYLRAAVGLTLNDQWFMKAKFR